MNSISVDGPGTQHAREKTDHPATAQDPPLTRPAALGIIVLLSLGLWTLIWLAIWLVRSAWQ
jgi:hypothetical protein